jgi:hypothetical protein
MLQAEIKNGSAFPVARHSESRGTIKSQPGGTEPYKKRFCLTRCTTPRRQHGHYSHTRGYKTAVYVT